MATTSNPSSNTGGDAPQRRQDAQQRPERPSASGSGGRADDRQAAVDRVPEQAPGAGDNVCPACGGSGRTSAGADCPECNGTGHVTTGIGGG